MKNNEELQKDVQDAIKWEPLLSAAEIGVIAKDGVITLTGVVDCYAKKIEAEEATKKVTGVKAVVEKIEIKFEGMGRKNDNEIASDALSALKWNWGVSNDKVKIKVEDGWVSMEGELHWNFQKESAQRSIKNIFGVKGVTNNITIKSETHDEVEKKGIERALKRNWSINDNNIQVQVSGKVVTLNGTVRSTYQRDEAERIAWNAPGVWLVTNALVVDYNGPVK